MDDDSTDRAKAHDVSAPLGDDTKKGQIVALYLSGMHDVEDLSMVTSSRPSYVASVLRDSGLEQSYFDLYTSTSHPMNVYSKFFIGKLGFKNVEAAERSVEHIDMLFKQFSLGKDRAGQHHAMMMAMTMGNRAHFTGKHLEAIPFRDWVIDRMKEFNDWSLDAIRAKQEEE